MKIHFETGTLRGDACIAFAWLTRTVIGQACVGMLVAIVIIKVFRLG